VTHLIHGAVVVGLVIVVATKHAKANLVERIAMAVLVVVYDHRRCPKTQKASLETAGSVSWNHSVIGRAVALAGDKFRVTGHPDGGGMRLMIVDCIRSAILVHLLMMENQRTTRGETVAAEWR
jgi:hypothetical protein